MWGGCVADHALRTGSGGFEVKLVEVVKGTELDEDSQFDEKDYSSICRIGWTVKEGNAY